MFIWTNMYLTITECFYYHLTLYLIQELSLKLMNLVMASQYFVFARSICI